MANRTSGLRRAVALSVALLAITAGAYNFAIEDAHGAIVAVIAAGAGNLKIFAGDLRYDPATNVINAGAYSIIAAGAYNIINAGAHNIINAGAHNLIDLAPDSVINAGAYNLTTLTLHGGASFGAALSSGEMTQVLTGAAGSRLQSDLSAGAAGPSGTLARAASAGSRKIATGKVRFGYTDRRGLLILRLTAQGRRLLATLARRNRARARHHKPLLALRLTLRDRFTPLVGKPHTITRRVTIRPGKPRKSHT